MFASVNDAGVKIGAIPIVKGCVLSGPRSVKFRLSRRDGERAPHRRVAKSCLHVRKPKASPPPRPGVERDHPRAPASRGVQRPRIRARLLYDPLAHEAVEQARDDLREASRGRFFPVAVVASGTLATNGRSCVGAGVVVCEAFGPEWSSVSTVKPRAQGPSGGPWTTSGAGGGDGFTTGDTFACALPVSTVKA